MALMTATAKWKEVKEAVKFIGLQEEPVIIASNPVQKHIKMSVVRRPSNAFGLEGKECSDGKIKPGLWALLWQLHFRFYFEDVAAGREPKRCMIFCRGMRLMAGIYSILESISGYSTAREADYVPGVYILQFFWLLANTIF